MHFQYLPVRENSLWEDQWVWCVSWDSPELRTAPSLCLPHILPPLLPQDKGPQCVQHYRRRCDCSFCEPLHGFNGVRISLCAKGGVFFLSVLSPGLQEIVGFSVSCWCHSAALLKSCLHLEGTPVKCGCDCWQATSSLQPVLRRSLCSLDFSDWVCAQQSLKDALVHIT